MRPELALISLVNSAIRRQRTFSRRLFARRTRICGSWRRTCRARSTREDRVQKRGSRKDDVRLHCRSQIAEVGRSKVCSSKKLRPEKGKASPANFLGAKGTQS